VARPGRRKLQPFRHMRPSLKNLPKRTAGKARAAAAGSPLPAGQEPPAAEPPSGPSAGERGAMRRRVRRLRRLRDVQLRELGALIVELRRLERDNPKLVARKAAEVRAIDEQLSGLRAALGEHQTLQQVVAAGVAGSCVRCGTLLATDDRYCPSCGRTVAEHAVEPPPPSPPPPPPPPPPPARAKPPAKPELTSAARPQP
jgi:hypothetical protein